MARVKRGTNTKRRHKKVLAAAKGYVGRSSTCYKSALQRVEKGLLYAYRDRKQKKRDFKSLWIQRINAGVRPFGINYSQFMQLLKNHKIELNRKMLSEVAIRDIKAFSSIVKQVLPENILNKENTRFY